MLQDKLAIELEYLNKRNLLSDVMILFSTILVIANSGASHRVLEWFGVNPGIGATNPQLSKSV